MPSSILLSGASGLLGRALRRSFEARGIPCTQLVRSAARPGSSEIFWNPYATTTSTEISATLARLEGARAAIHLSGDNIGAGRWTHAKKQRIWESRVASTQAIAALLSQMHSPPEVLICASAVGYYGNRGDSVMTEDSPAGSGFLAETCLAWEQASVAAQQRGIRVVHLRLGAVLAREGGALEKMLPIFRKGLGGRLGNGSQWMSWISLPDVVRSVEYLLANATLAGPVNAVAPQPVTNTEFTQTLARLLHRPAGFQVPALVLRALLGEMADSVLLSSTRAVPARLQQAGFIFEHATLESALRDTLRDMLYDALAPEVLG